jgi:hypothetical protein
MFVFSFQSSLSNRIRAAAAVLTIALLAQAASAQSTDEDPFSSARLRLGPLAVNPSLALTSLGIDPNVFNESREPKRDFTASIEPQAQAWLRLGRARLSSRSRLELVYFQKYLNERSVNSDNQVRLELLLNRVKPFIEMSFLNSRQRPGYEIDARARREEESVKVGGQIRLLGQTWLEMAAHRSRVDFDADAEFLGTRLRDVLNRTVERVSAALRYPVTPLTTLVLFADTQRDRFELSRVRDSKSVRIIPGVEFGSRALISGRAFVGYHRFNSLAAGFPGYRGLSALVDLGYTLRGSTRFAVRGERDVTYSFEVSEPYYVHTGISGSVTQVLARPWEAKVTWAQEQLDYRRLGASEVATTRVDRVRRYGAGVGYRMQRDTRVGVDLDYYRRQSDVDERQYDTWRAGTSVTYGF